MNLPFSTEQFFGVFAAYNLAIWPAQILAYILGALAVAAIFKKSAWANRFISGVLALAWFWTGVVYHSIHFAAINPAAKLFGVLFVLQGLLFTVAGVILNLLAFNWSIKPNSSIGATFIIYSMLLYPLLGFASGHHYPSIPMFGVTPCPLTIFTFGMLLLVSTKVPWFILPVPFLWSLVGMSAAVNLHVPQDYGLFVAGMLGTAMVLLRNRRHGKNPG